MSREAIKAGDVVAKEGAWQRKYLVRAVTQLVPEIEASKYGERVTRRAVVALKPLGTYYADTRKGMPSNAPVREVLTEWTEYHEPNLPMPEALADNEARLNWYTVDQAATHRYTKDGSI